MVKSPNSRKLLTQNRHPSLSLSNGGKRVRTAKQRKHQLNILPPFRLRAEATSDGETIYLKTEQANTWQRRATIESSAKALKRPMLEAHAYEDGNPDLDYHLAMYQFNSLTEWLDHPLKRLKTADNDDADSRQQRHQGPLPSSRATAGDPYEFDDDVSAGKLRSYNANAQPGTAIKDEFQVKVEAKVGGLHCLAVIFQR